MEGVFVFLIVFGIVIVLFVNSMLEENKNEKKKLKKEMEEARHSLWEQKNKNLEIIKVETEKLEDEKKRLKKDHEELEVWKVEWDNERLRLVNEFNELIQSFEGGYLKGRKWLAEAFSEFVNTRDLEVESALVIKPNPSWKGAELVSEMRAKRVQMARELNFFKYQVASYEEYFPFLVEYRDAILDEIVDMRKGEVDELLEVDPALSLGFLTKEEYVKLPSAQKFQMALDRYWKKDKSNIEIGRLYERYIGYNYEKEGWRVRYEGALKGFEDFGRDLICTKNGNTHIVQCKCWSKHRVIREKHIMQLFGTCILYKITENLKNVDPIFSATTELSDEARMVAKELGVDFKYNELQRYPMIKCNINPGTGEKIYHLPFDQQYDKVIIGNVEGELYADKVEDAEKKGFRRAFKWKGNKESEA